MVHGPADSARGGLREKKECPAKCGQFGPQAFPTVPAKHPEKVDISAT